MIRHGLSDPRSVLESYRRLPPALRVFWLRKRARELGERYYRLALLRRQARELGERYYREYVRP